MGKASHRAKSRYKSHILIPDLQVRSDVDYSHVAAIGEYIVHAKPDRVIQIGDLCDNRSLNRHDSKLASEGKRLKDDLASCRHALELLTGPTKRYNSGRKVKYLPDWVITLGNHEAFLERFVEENPALHGFFGEDPFGFREFGFRTYPFLQIAKLDLIEYVHFLPGGGGNAITTAAGLLRARHSSISVGHSHKIEIAYHATHHIGLISGAAYTHSEPYAHGVDNFKRGIWRKEEVREGTYDPLFISVDYLKRRWSK